MKRLTRAFATMKKEGRCGLIAYVTCGDPDPETTVRIVEELVRAGADAIELGIPFSDPIADGPVIQAASHRALTRGTKIDDVFDIARTLREETEVPLIAFSYLNPILRFGVERFADAAKEAGIDAVLITDLPPESAKEVRSVIRERGLDTVFLITPTTSLERAKRIDRATGGFVYYVSTTGVTGARAQLEPDLIERIRTLRSELRHPLAVGFGVSTNEQYRMLAPHCDAVVVGSAIVRRIGESVREEAPARAASVVRAILGTTGEARS